MHQVSRFQQHRTVLSDSRFEYIRLRNLFGSIRFENSSLIQYVCEARSQTTPIVGRPKILGGKTYWKVYLTSNRSNGRFENRGLQNNAASEPAETVFDLYPYL